MKTWLHKIKKISTICTFSATLGLPLLVLVTYLIGIREAYSNLKVSFPIHPYTVSLASVLPYLAVLYLAAYLFKKRHRIGELGLLATVFIVLTNNLPTNKSFPSLFRLLWRNFLSACLLASLTACTGAPQIISGRAFHSLSFDPSRESEGIQVIYYRYGSADQFGLRTDPDQVASGKSTGVAITGDLPVGNDFYVKWRIVATGQVIEDTVDLKSGLPFDMNKQTLKPIIEGRQLCIYLISYEPVRDIFSVDEAEQIRRLQISRREKVFSYMLRNKVIQIYPTRIEDPQLPAKFKK